MELIKIDLSKSFIAPESDGGTNDHPDLKTDGTAYLCRLDGEFFAGTFDREWFGLNFNGWYNCLQYDAPGTNQSFWEDVWEIKEN